jgi:DNA-binding response OmpR family regulator
MDSQDEERALRSARAQAAVVRTLTDAQRRGDSGIPSAGLREQSVEDEDPTRSAIVLGLTASFDVAAAADGVEGLRAALERPFDAIVTDLRMPRMDGITMVEKIHDAYGGAMVPVVFLTAETDPVRVAAGFSSGAASFMVKPLDLELLAAELRWLLGKANGG